MLAVGLVPALNLDSLGSRAYSLKFTIMTELAGWEVLMHSESSVACW